jgi:hypothetical protein
MMSRDDMNPEIKALAQRLIHHDAGLTSQAEDAEFMCRVCEKLRRPLTSLAGKAGFVSLLGRALTLAKREAPALSAVQVRPDGLLEGLSGETVEANPILVACLLSLLFTFIGEHLTMRLLQDIWPDLPYLGQALRERDSK